VVLIRRILAAVIALSLAALPATAEALVSPLPAEATMTDQADMPCCPSCNTQDDVKAIACVLKCAAFTSRLWEIGDIVNVLEAFENRRTAA
jgi:hypothetical protein